MRLERALSLQFLVAEALGLAGVDAESFFALLLLCLEISFAPVKIGVAFKG